MNYRDEYGVGEARVPSAYKSYIVTLDDLDSHVYEFGRGCEEGQQQFVEFVMQKVLTPHEWETLQEERNFARFCRQWEVYEQLANDERRKPCVYGFDSIYDEDSEYEWPFCSNCYKTEEQHCHCGDCEIGAEHLKWAIDNGIVHEGR